MTEAIEPVEGVEDVLLSEDQDGGEDQTNTEAEAQDEGEQAEEQPAPKPKKTAQERINELTRKARDAERREALLMDMLQQRQPGQPPARQPAQVQPRDEAPHPDDFTHGDADPNYLVALAKYEAKTEVRAELKAEQEAKTTQERVTGFIAKEAELFPEGESEGLSAYKSLRIIRPEIQDVVLTSDKGPLLAEHLGDNPSVLNRLNGLAPHLVGFELARIEAALSAPAPSPVNRVTKAPDPAPKPRGSGGQFAVSPETNDFAAFERLADKVRSS